MGRPHRTKHVKSVCGLLVLLLCLGGAAEKPRAKGLTVGLYASVASEPIAVLRVESLHPSHQRRGFFRIGILPGVTAEGVTVEIRDTGRVKEALTAVGDWCRGQSLATGSLELRRLTIQSRGAKVPELTASRAVLAEQGKTLELENSVVQFHQSTNLPKKARLVLVGESAGRVSWREDRETHNYLLFTPAKTRTSTETKH